jgi:hypothetical protein
VVPDEMIEKDDNQRSVRAEQTAALPRRPDPSEQMTETPRAPQRRCARRSSSGVSIPRMVAQSGRGRLFSKRDGGARFIEAAARRRDAGWLLPPNLESGAPGPRRSLLPSDWRAAGDRKGDEALAGIEADGRVGGRSDSPKLSGAAPPNRASRATIALLESDRPDAPRASDAYGDVALVALVGRPLVRRLRLEAPS